MADLKHLLERNRIWAEELQRSDPGFFNNLSEQQSPKYLWIGCSDSRVPANQIVGMLPGEIFVHRNIANLVVHTDLNCLSVIQFAVDVLKIEHIIVCGHYGCSGVRAALDGQRHGLVDNWLRHIGDTIDKHQKDHLLLGNYQQLHARLCELNVIEQAMNVCQTTVLQDAWAREQAISVHAWIYSLGDGRINDLGFTAVCTADLEKNRQQALSRLGPPA